MEKILLILSFGFVLNAGAQQAKDSSVNYTYPRGISFKGIIAMMILRTGDKNSLEKDFENNTFDTCAAPIPGKYFGEFNIAISQVNGHNVYTISPKTNASGKYILYLHGGAYVHSFVKQHWKLIAELVRKTGHTVVAPDYPLAPVHTVENNISMVERVYKNLLAQTKPENIIFMGDSAGGGLALALAQHAKKNKLPQPAALILLSPWLDVTLTNPGIKALEKKDPMLGVEGSRMAGEAYAGKLSTKNYLVSPIYGDIEGLAKISVFIGGKDLLLPDARKFKGMLEEKGIALNYFEYPKMFHVWIAATFLKESKTAVNQVVELIR